MNVVSFVDWDMVMRYYGGGIGHLKNTPLQQVPGCDPIDPSSEEMAVEDEDKDNCDPCSGTNEDDEDDEDENDKEDSDEEDSDGNEGDSEDQTDEDEDEEGEDNYGYASP